MEGFSEPLDEIESIPSKRVKKPSGHVAAGKKWDTSEKGRIWKEQTIRAKHELRDIIKQRTGLDTFANQRMTLKYAGFIRDGKKAAAKRIIEQVVESAKRYNKGTRKIQREPLQRQQQRRNKTARRNVAEHTATAPAVGFKENSAEFGAAVNFQRNIQPNLSRPVQPSFQPIQQPTLNSAEKYAENTAMNTTMKPAMNTTMKPVDTIQLPDLLD
jgi:hypothetical protein